jgi:hypothetical protein
VLVAFLIAALPSPEQERADATETDEAQVYTPPKPLRLTAAMRREVDGTVNEFVRTAVLRGDVARSWELASPALRVGVTRAEWMRGDLPVYPYPADPARTEWDLDYADETEVALNVTLVPRRGAAEPPEVFGVSLEPVRRGQGRRWLVSSWYPRGSVSQPQSPAAGQPAGPPPPPAPEELESVRRASEGQIDRIWWLVPAGILALIVLGPLAYFGALRARRALRRQPTAPS